MTKFLVVLSILFLSFILFIDYKQKTVFPQFTDEEIEFICKEEGLI